MKEFRPWTGSDMDPACPYDEDYTAEDEEAAYEAYVDRWIDDRMER